MATTLPFGIRVAAGLVATSFDHLVKLPGELPGLTVSFAGQLLRTSMRVRQEVAELATRGDELLAPLIGGAEEHPAWATFDEDEEKPDDASTDTGGDATADSAGDGDARPAAADPYDTTPAGGASTSGPILVTGAERAGAEIPLDELYDDDLDTEGQSGSPDADLPPNAQAQDATRTLIGSLAVESTAGGSGSQGGGADAQPHDFLDLPADADAGVDDLVFSTSSDAYDSPILVDHELSVAELKDRLPDLDSAAVRLLLAQEESGPNRAPYLTLLTNRLTTLQHENR